MSALGWCCIGAAAACGAYIALWPDKAGLHYTRADLLGLRRRRGHSCGLCGTERARTVLKRRLREARRPGPGWAARVRYALSETEWEARRQYGMRVDHPDWLTGELREHEEELLAGLDADTWEAGL